MNRKSISLEYFALATDKNGNIPPMRKNESNGGIVVAGFMDLLLGEIVTVNKKKITVIKELPEELEHITILYTYLKEKPRSPYKLMSDFYSGGKLKQLITDIGKTLFSEGLASKGSGGIFGPKTTYISDKKYKDELIGNVKSAVTKITDGTPHDLALMYILHGSRNLHQYFPGDEFNLFKMRVKEMKKDPQYKQLANMINFANEMVIIILFLVLVFFVSL